MPKAKEGTGPNSVPLVPKYPRSNPSNVPPWSALMAENPRGSFWSTKQIPSAPFPAGPFLAPKFTEKFIVKFWVKSSGLVFQQAPASPATAWVRVTAEPGPATALPTSAQEGQTCASDGE